MERQIIASFKYGRVVLGKRSKILRVCFYILCFLQLLMLTMLVIITATGNFMGKDDEWLVLIFANIFILLMFGIWIIINSTKQAAQ